MYEREIAVTAKAEWSFTYERVYHIHQVLVLRPSYIPETVSVNKNA
jgi:hypothetical protein